MKTAYVFTIHQTNDAHDPIVFEGFTTHQERLYRAQKHALKIDAVFTCYSVPSDDDEWTTWRDMEKAKFKSLLHWGWDLPKKFEMQ